VAPNPTGGDRPPAYRKHLWSDNGGGIGRVEGRRGEKQTTDLIARIHTHARTNVYCTYVYIILFYGDRAIRYLYFLCGRVEKMELKGVAVVS